MTAATILTNSTNLIATAGWIACGVSAVVAFVAALALGARLQNVCGPPDVPTRLLGLLVGSAFLAVGGNVLIWIS